MFLLILSHHSVSVFSSSSVLLMSRVCYRKLDAWCVLSLFIFCLFWSSWYCCTAVSWCMMGNLSVSIHRKLFIREILSVNLFVVLNVFSFLIFLQDSMTELHVLYSFLRFRHSLSDTPPLFILRRLLPLASHLYVAPFAWL